MFELKPEKYKDLPFLMNTIKEQDDQFNKPRYSFFLGAGCSVSSNIPSAKGVIEILQKYAFVEQHKDGHVIDKGSKYIHSKYLEEVNKFVDENKNDFNVYIQNKEREFKASISKDELVDRIPQNIIAAIKDNENIDGDMLKDKLFDTFSDKIYNDTLYSKWFEEYSEDPRVRQRLIESIIEEQHIRGEYILFANLIAHGLIHNIFTSNFDDLIYETLITYVNKKAKVYSHNEIAKYISIGGSKPTIIKLHGDYLYESIKNLLNETKELENNMKEKFQESLKYFDLIVVGYGGADVSIMSVLEDLKSERPFRLIWCGRNPDSLNWRAINLINYTQNSFFIQIDSFSELVLKLWNTFNVPIVNLTEIATEKQKELDNYIAEFDRSLQTDLKISDEEKEVFKKSLKANEYLRLAYDEQNQDNKIKLYTEGIKFYPNDSALYNDRGVAFAHIGEQKKAIKDFTEAINLRKSDEYLYLYLANRATSYPWLEKYTEALDDIDKALILNPQHASAWSTKGLILYNQKKGVDKNTILSYLNKAVEINPNDPGAYADRGFYYMDIGEYELAKIDFDKSEPLQVNKYKKSNLYNNLAVLNRKLGDIGKAKQYIKKARELNPRHPLIDGTSALIYADQGLKKKFYKQLEIALKNGCPAWRYLDDPGFNRYRETPKLKALIKKYKDKFDAENN
jgi:Flp pilus assembly protein TadD